MKGAFGNIERVRKLGFEPDVVYVGLEKIQRHEENVVPLLWVPKAESLEEGVVDVYGRRYLFAFNNSGCIANPNIICRALKAIEKAHELGYDKIMLDALRLPSPVDGIYFLSTCFCEHSIKLWPRLKKLRSKIKDALRSPSANSILEILDELAEIRAAHVENLLAIIYDESKDLGIELIAAVFPYPISKYVGQDPKILRSYLSEVHVMLYHKCSGAACLNAEIKGLVNTLRGLGLKEEGVLRVIETIFGLDLKMEEVNSLDDGIGLGHLNFLIDLSESTYGNSFVPILWLDEILAHKVNYYVNKFRDLDLFAP